MDTPQPIQQPQAPDRAMHNHDRSRRGNFFAILLILIGVIALINQLFPKSWIKWELFWPIVIILIGVRMMTRQR